MIVLIPLTSSAASKMSSNTAKAAVTKYLKAIQSGICPPILFDMDDDVPELMKYDKERSPKTLWLQIEKKHRAEWKEQCESLHKEMITEKKERYDRPYLPPLASWKIMEMRRSVMDYWDAFVKISYSEADAPCKEKNHFDDKQLLKSQIITFSVHQSGNTPKISMRPNDSEADNLTKEFYPDVCEVKKKEY